MQKYLRKPLALVCLLFLVTATHGCGSGSALDERKASLEEAEPTSEEVFDLVIENGEVYAPELREIGEEACTTTDYGEAGFPLCNIAIEGGAITRIVPREVILVGRETINAEGLVVSPGFIDLHSHAITPLAQEYQVYDGVTTALNLEGGYYPVDRIGEKVEDNALINFGASAGYFYVKLWVKNGVSLPVSYGDPDCVPGKFLKCLYTAILAVFHNQIEAISPTLKWEAGSDFPEIQDLMLESLEQGALGIGLLLDYMTDGMPAGGQEIEWLFELSATTGAPLFVHIRRGYPYGFLPEACSSDALSPTCTTNTEHLRELLDLAERVGAHLHVVHVTHNAVGQEDLADFFAEMESARTRGVDVTTEVLPFDAGSTPIGADVFSRDWRNVFGGLALEDIHLAKNGESMSEEEFAKTRDEEPQSFVIHHYLEDNRITEALQEPGVMVVTDIVSGYRDQEMKVPPFHGAFSRVLGEFVREKGVLQLWDALDRMTLLPARRLEDYVPVFARKGRLQEGMDADITIFDKNTIIHRAEYPHDQGDPWRKSAGVQYVIVNGQIVLENKCADDILDSDTCRQLRPGVYPGKLLLKDR